MVDMIPNSLETQPWDAVAHLETEEDMTAYLNAALEEGDPAIIVAVLGDIARAKGMTQQVVKIVYWQETDAMWLGYLEQHPDYMTQGYTLEELKENLRDIYKHINADTK